MLGCLHRRFRCFLPLSRLSSMTADHCIADHCIAEGMLPSSIETLKSERQNWLIQVEEVIILKLKSDEQL